MTLAYVGSFSLPLLCPVVQASIGDVGVGINAKISGNLALNASMSASPPTLASVEANVSQTASNLSLASSLGLPALSFDVTSAGTLVASLSASFGQLVTLNGLLGAAIGAYAFAYEGAASGLGAAVTAQLATQWPDAHPSSGACNAIVLGAVTGIAQTQVQAFLNGLSVGSGLVYTGKIGLSALTPVTASATGQGNSAIQTQLNGALALQARASVTPPTLAASAVALGKFGASLKVVPNVQFALSATAKIAAHTSASFGLVASLGAALNRADATVFAYTYAGAGNALGAALTSALSSTWPDGTSTSGSCLAVVLGSVDSLTWTTLLSFFGAL